MTNRDDVQLEARTPRPRVKVYFFDIDALEVNDPRLRRLLPLGELAYSLRFHFDADRLRYLVGRAMLRTIMSGFTGQSPFAINVRVGSHGKPFVEGCPAFNLSHSGSAVLLGVTTARTFGLDVEHVRPLSDIDDLARHCFSTTELEAFDSCTRDERSLAFFRTWTRKEAFIKALGGGLSIDLKSFSVSFQEGGGNLLFDASRCVAKPQEWSIEDIGLPGSYVGAVALDAPDFIMEIMAFELGTRKHEALHGTAP